jgi:hypothetical protein
MMRGNAQMLADKIEKLSDPLRGKTIRLTWTDGPTKGKTHEHVFHQDSTVEWHAVGADGEKADSGNDPERPRFADFPAGDGACAFSYLSNSGYTLTVILRFEDGSMVGFASNDRDWHPVRGTFEVMNANGRRKEVPRNSPRMTSSPRAIW